MAALALISAVAGIAGSFISARGTLAAGKAQQQALNYEAAQLDVEAKQKQAEAQIEASQYKRNKDLKLSTLQNEAAASGFSATDPTSLSLADDITKYGTFQEQLAQYGGQVQRAGIEAQAEGRRMTGRAAVIGSRYAAAGTILGGISSMASKFNPSTAGVSSSSFMYG
jgi:hypothetical protein